MPADQMYLLIFTQVLLLGSLLWALWSTHQLYRCCPKKRWRVILIMVWLSFGLLASVSTAVIMVIGCPSLPVLRLLLWIDRTTLTIGYLACGLTTRQLLKHYKD